jgi:hypothetical protein
MLGTDIRVLAGRRTGSSFSLMTCHLPPGQGPPPHIHDDEDEAFYVLEGLMRFKAGTDVSVNVTTPPAQTALGVAETTRCVSECSAKASCIWPNVLLGRLKSRSSSNRQEVSLLGRWGIGRPWFSWSSVQISFPGPRRPRRNPADSK